MHRKAFSLAEVVIAAAVVIIMTGCLVLAVTGKSVSTEREARELAEWLTERITAAQAEESSFWLLISQRASAQGNAQLKIVWASGRRVNTSEIYQNDKVYMYDLARIDKRTYDGVWQTMTPALTICVRPLDGNQKEALYVKVSGVGQTVVSKKWKD